MIQFFQLLINLQQTFRISGDVLNIATFVFNFIEMFEKAMPASSNNTENVLF